jgi:hypothetical protein
MNWKLKNGYFEVQKLVQSFMINQLPSHQRYPFRNHILKFLRQY